MRITGVALGMERADKIVRFSRQKAKKSTATPASLAFRTEVHFGVRVSAKKLRAEGALARAQGSFGTAACEGRQPRLDAEHPDYGGGPRHRWRMAMAMARLRSSHRPAARR